MGHGFLGTGELVVDTLTRMPTRREFDSSQEEALLQALDVLERNTLLVPCRTPEMLWLSDDGKLPGDYVLSPLAFRQLCSTVSPGLCNLVLDIAGERRREETASDAVVSPALAARIINSCVKLRFNTKNGPYMRRFVQDVEQRSVEGFVGAGYRWLPHAQLVEMVTHRLTSFQPGVTFHSAVIAGRRLGIAYQTEHPLVTVPGLGIFHLGYYFCNSEAGECGVHGGVCVVLRDQPFRALGPLRDVRHAGLNFEKKIQALTTNAMNDGEQWMKYDWQSTVGNLQRSLVLVTPGGKYDPAQTARLAERFRRKHLSADLVRAVMRWTVYAGGDGDYIPGKVKTADLASRTVLSLFTRLLRMAVAQYPKHREKMERLAFLLLTGEMKI